jgi:HEPN domain-containing protein
MNEESARMMELARRDLRAAHAMAADTVAFTDEIFGFHAQQAVEKACKAWMCGLGVVYPKTHDLDLLFHLLSESGVRVPMEYEALLDLVDFSVQYRYEAFDELPIDRCNTLLLATRFIEHVAARLANPG